MVAFPKSIITAAEVCKENFFTSWKTGKKERMEIRRDKAHDILSPFTTDPFPPGRLHLLKIQMSHDGPTSQEPGI